MMLRTVTLLALYSLSVFVLLLLFVLHFHFLFIFFSFSFHLLVFTVGKITCLITPWVAGVRNINHWFSVF